MRIDLRAWLKLPLPTMALGLGAFTVATASIVVALGGTRAAELLATPANPPAPLNIALATAPPSPDLAAIQSQPLMYATRAFHVAPPPDATPATPPLPDYRLAGSFIVPNKPAVALLANKQSGATRRVHVGDELDGWRVQTVEAKRVVLNWQEQQREITSLAAPPAAGLKRVPMQRQRVAATTGTVQSLGSGGNGNSSSTRVFDGGSNDAPRLYRPPPP